MRRSTVRCLQSCVALVLLMGFLGAGPWGCIPSFRGLKPVTKAELNPKKKSGAAEILFHKEYRQVWWGQVGMPPSMTFRRVYRRVRINSVRGLKAATVKVIPGSLLAFRAKSTCPDGRVVEIGKDDIARLSEKTGYYPFLRWNKEGNRTRVSASGASVGCIVDFYWEEDRPGIVASQFSSTIPLVQEFPLRKAHIRLHYNHLQAVRPSLTNMDGLWLMIQRKRLAKLMAAMKAKKKGDAKKPAGFMLTQKEKDKHVRLEHNTRSRVVDLRLNDLPGLSVRARKGMMLKAKAGLLPNYYLRPPMFSLLRIRTFGIRGRELAVVWRNIDETYTRGRSWNDDDRTIKERNFQIDEETELKKIGLPAVARKLAGAVSSRDAKIKTLYEHLRRRMLVTMASTSSRSKLNKVYLLGRGTSYEINMMLVVMLRAVGIRAYPAFSVPNNRTYQSLPPNPLFRNAVAYVAPASEGKWRGVCDERRAARKFRDSKGDSYQGGRKVKGGQVLDASDKYLPFGAVSEKYTDVSVFAVDGMGGRFFEVPAPKSSKNKLQRVLKATVQPDGTFKATITVSAWGNQASKLRWQFHKVNAKLWEQKRVGLAFRGSCAKEAKVKLVNQPKLSPNGLVEPFTFTYSVDAASCITHGQHGFLFKADTGVRLPTLRAPIRVHPISLGTPHSFHRRMEVTFPKGYKPAIANRNVKATGPGGMNMQLSATANGNVLIFDLKRQHSQRWLVPAAYPKVKAFFNKFAFTKNWQIAATR